jgi:cyclic-di-GMP-binding biofilm dispersal mediator protein
MTRVLITGGAKGLGHACVSTALTDGCHVTVLDADANGLTQLPAGVSAIYADLADAAELRSAINRLSASEPFDIVIMNAGINATGPFETLPVERQAKLIAVNLTAPMALTTALIQADKIARDGRLVFVSSLSHFVSYPGASTYAGTKDGLTIFARSLRRPLRRSLGIRVQVVAPGPMDTDHATEHSPSPDDRRARVAPAFVADAIWRNRSGFLIVPGMAANGVSILGRLLPGVAGRIMRRMIFEKLQVRTPVQDTHSAREHSSLHALHPDQFLTEEP